MSQQSSFSSSSSVNLTSINPLHYIFEIRFSSSIVWLATKPLDDEIAPKSPVSVTRLPAAAPPLKGLQAGGWTPPQRSSKNRMRLAPSKARRLRSEVIWLQSPKDIQRWFLKKKKFFGGASYNFYNFSHAKIGCCPGEPLNIQVYGEVRGWKMFVKWHVGHIHVSYGWWTFFLLNIFGVEDVTFFLKNIRSTVDNLSNQPLDVIFTTVF